VKIRIKVGAAVGCLVMVRIKTEKNVLQELTFTHAIVETAKHFTSAFTVNV